MSATGAVSEPIAYCILHQGSILFNSQMPSSFLDFLLILWSIRFRCLLPFSGFHRLRSSRRERHEPSNRADPVRLKHLPGQENRLCIEPEAQQPPAIGSTNPHQRTLSSFSLRIFSRNSPTSIDPSSPSLRERTATVPPSTSLSPTTSMYGIFSICV
jgi:hypothetical protein